jgi:hypothetical protein
MTDNLPTPEWQSEGRVYHTGDTPWLRLHSYYERPLAGKKKLRIDFNSSAQDALVNAPYVRLERSTANEQFRIRLTPTTPIDAKARRVRLVISGSQRHATLGGAAQLHRRHGFPLGYYYMDSDKVFTWRHP